jgi:hypothetical protein
MPASGNYSSHIICGLEGGEGVLHISSSVKRRESDPYLYADPGTENMYVANLRNGSRCIVRYLEFAGENHISISYRGNFTGKMRIVDENTAELIAEIDLKCSKGAEKDWIQSGNIIGACFGVRSLAFVIEGEGELEWNSFEFSAI